MQTNHGKAVNKNPSTTGQRPNTPLRRATVNGKLEVCQLFNNFVKMSYLSESRTRPSPGRSWTGNGGLGTIETVDYDLGPKIVQKLSKNCPKFSKN